MNKCECIDIIKKVKIGYLATCDTNLQPYVRPIDMGTVYDSNIYFATFNNTNKIQQIANVNKVEVVFLYRYTQIRIIGIVEKIENIEMINRFMRDNRSISDLDNNSKEAKMILYCIVPICVRYMGNDDNYYSKIDWE